MWSTLCFLATELGYKNKWINEALKQTDADKTVFEFTNKHYSGITKGVLMDHRFVVPQFAKEMHL
jgi:hypothetical protein